MEWRIRATFVLLCIAFSLTSIHNVLAEQRVVCYYTNWSVYRPGTAKFSPQNINPYLCTHLIYAFGGFTKDNTLKPFDKYQDIEKGGYAKFNGLKTYNKKLKTMLAIGGWNEGSARFSALVADPERREELVKNSVKFLRQNHFDGLDLDWEYPAFRDGGKPRDKNNYADFVQELRAEFERESLKTGRPRLLLSMAIPAGIEYLEKGYDLPRLNEHLDFFNLLSYDYHSAFEPAVNHHAPLYGLEEDNEYNYDNELTIDYTISYLLKHEVTSDKLILGIPTYGRSYTLFNEDATEIGSPADGPGEEGDATREKGYLAYYEICENIGKSEEWEVVQPNPKAMGPYAVRENQWVGYDDEAIVRLKAQYVNEKGLGGIMFWSIDNDDFRGKCHDRPYPLIEAAKEAMLAGNNRKVRPNPKTKSNSDRKKTRLSSNNQQSEDDSTRYRQKTGTNRRRTGLTTSTTRKRISSTNGSSRSSGKNRLNTEDNDEEQEEDVESAGNSVRQHANKYYSKPQPRTRANRIAPKRKVQSRRGDDQLEDGIDESDEPSSNKLTTPEPPTTPDPGSDFKCQDEGFFSHPRDCKKYFWCLDSGPSGLGIVANQFTCPSGLVFNKIADSCDYPRNVICPKTKNPTTTSTTKAPKTTTRATHQEKPNRRTTTTETPNSAEEYEYDDEELNIAEDEEEEEEEIVDRNTARSTTIKPLIYRTITRNRPTTTTTGAPTTTASRNFKQNTHNVLDLKDEEDPRVLKELIDLIKKAGGLEQLEKQLNLQDKHLPDAEDNKHMTPATISRSLYERVLNRQAPKISGLFSESTTRTVVPENDVTERKTPNSGTRYRNGPGGAQFEGLDDVPEVKSLRRAYKPQYVTIERPKPSSTQTSFVDEDEEDDLPQQDEFQPDNTDVASSEERAISNPPDDDDNAPTKKITPSYVNIRRTRPSTPANHNDLEDKNEHSPTTSTSKGSDEQQQTATPKSRYTNIQRFRSTTTHSTDPIKTMSDVSNLTEHTPMFLIHPTTPDDSQNEEESTATSLSPTQTLTTFSSALTESTTFASETVITTEFTTPGSTLTTTQHSPAVDPATAIIENSIAENPQSTISVVTTPNTPTSKVTTSAAQPRPFGFSRRGRPTTASIATTTTSTTTTDQSRIKVSSIPTRNFVRVRTRGKTTTESTVISNQHPDNHDGADDEINRDKVVNRSRVNSRRRGSSKFTTAAPIAVINETTSNFISSRSTETTVATVDRKQNNFSKRRRERLSTALTKEATTEAINRRRRPISRSSDEPLTDSPIIRISPKYFDEKSIRKYGRGGFKNNSVGDREEITKIRILKISDQIDANIDALNTIEATTTAYEVTTDSTPTFMTTILPSATNDDVTASPQNKNEFMSDSNSNSSIEISTEHEQAATKKRPDLLKRKVLLRRRLISPSTPDSSDAQTTSKPNRRRKVVRLLGPVTIIPVNDMNDNTDSTTTDIPLQFTTLEDISDFTSYPMSEVTTVDPTSEEFITEPAINNEELMSTIYDTERTEQPPNDDIESTEITTNNYSQLNHLLEESTIPTTSSSLPTTEEKPNPRFIRKMFIRKRPIDSIPTSPDSTTIRQSGFTRFTSSPPSPLSASKFRRKSLFIRKRPLTSTETIREVDERFEGNIDWEEEKSSNKTSTSGVSREKHNFWKQITPPAKSPLTLTSSHQGNIIFDDSSPQESAEKLADIVSNRQSRTHIGNNKENPKIFESASSNRDKFNSGGINTFWQRQTSKTRSYPRQSIITTESSVTETLIPSRKFDFIADAVSRRQQLPKTIIKSSSNDDYSADNKQTSVTPQTKPQVTRLVTSVFESGTTERQIIRIKTKYSSLTSTTKFPIDSPMNINNQFLQQLDKNNIFADESRHVLLNEIHSPTERILEKSTLPIENEFSRRGRYFTTEPSAQSSTIAIESVESKYFKKLPTLKELINNNIEHNRNIAASLEPDTDIQIPVRLFGGPEGAEMISDQLAFLRIPENTSNSTIWQNLQKTRFLDDSNHIQVIENITDSKTEITGENVGTDTTGIFPEIDISPVTLPSTENIIRGFYVTKTLLPSQPKIVESSHVEEIKIDTMQDVPDSLETTTISPTSSTNQPAVDPILKEYYTETQTTNEYLGNTLSFLPTTIINISDNSSESINKMEDYHNISTKSSVTDVRTDATSSSTTTITTTAWPLSSTHSEEIKPMKQIIIRRRRPSLRGRSQSMRHHVASNEHVEIIQNMQSLRPSNWSRKIIKKRPISDSASDQNIAETQPHEFVQRQIPPTILLDVPNKMRSGDMNATVEINLFRSATTLRKPGTIRKQDGHDRSRPPSENPIGNMKISEMQYSSKVSADIHDQSGRAQELLAVSIADPPTATSTIGIGNDSTMQNRGIQRHKIGTRYDVHTVPPTVVRTTVTPVRRRQRPKNEYKINFDTAAPTSRRPAIIDYDYYVDEEVRLSIKPELKDKIYITKTGSIRCLDQGNFAHPTSCKKFITCAPMVGGQVIATEYTCPAKLSFDPVGGICNWSAGLGCTP